MNYAQNQTDKMLKDLERCIRTEYDEARISVKKKAVKAWNDYQEQYKKKKKQYDDGEITWKELRAWQKEKINNQEWYKQMQNTLAQDIVHANDIAVGLINKSNIDVYALNMNYGTYEIENQLHLNTSFTLYNHAAVERLLLDGEAGFVKLNEDIPKDLRWNKKHINSAIVRGILAGDSVKQIQQRLIDVVGMDENASMRNARTWTTSAENAGHMDAMKRAEGLGIKVSKQWMATPDSRVRDSHAVLDGEIVGMDEKVSNGCMYPGDPNGKPEEIYNCRCRIVSALNGMDNDISDLSQRFSRMPEGMSYEEWKKMHNPKKEKKKTKVVEGKDLSNVWKRRSDQFNFEIDDVINAQGFDGFPRVVSAEEFDKAVQESNFIAQRVYSAPDQETLDAYRNALYSGKWYVDCSSGGAAYGRGMYSVYNKGTSVTEYMDREINGYRGRRGVDYSYTETFTLIPEAKTITPNEIIDLRNEYQKNLMDEFKKRGGWGNKEAIEWASNHDIHGLDDGTVAALFGYDAILTHGIDDYAVILNRTKCIFKG